jgi:hypothetical protein
MRSSDAVDPSLGPGFAYFVKSDEYLAHLAKYVDQDEVCFTFCQISYPLLMQNR